MENEARLRYQDWPPGSALGIRHYVHDLMTPLTVIMGNLQLFQMRKDLPEAVMSKVGDLFAQSKNLQRLLTDLQQHAYEDAWGGNSGAVSECWKMGSIMCISVLTRNFVKVDHHSECKLVYKGHREEWHEFFAGLLGSVSSHMVRDGRIGLSGDEQGWTLEASPMDPDSSFFQYWLSLLTTPVEDELASVRRYHGLLQLNGITPQVSYEDTKLVMRFPALT